MLDELSLLDEPDLLDELSLLDELDLLDELSLLDELDLLDELSLFDELDLFDELSLLDELLSSLLDELELLCVVDVDERGLGVVSANALVETAVTIKTAASNAAALFIKSFILLLFLSICP